MGRETFIDGVKSVGYVLQADAVLTQSNATETTDYTVLDTTPNVRIYSIYAEATETDTVTNLKVTITIDGVSIVHTQASVTTGTPYYCNKAAMKTAATQTMTDSDPSNAMAFLCEGRSVKVAVQCTTTGSDADIDTLECRVKYGKIP